MPVGSCGEEDIQASRARILVRRWASSQVVTAQVVSDKVKRAGEQRLSLECSGTDPHPDLGTRESFTSLRVMFELRLDGGGGSWGSMEGVGVVGLETSRRGGN